MWSPKLWHKPHPLLYTHLSEAKSQSYNLRPTYVLHLYPTEPQNCPYRHLKQAHMSILHPHGSDSVSWARIKGSNIGRILAVDVVLGQPPLTSHAGGSSCTEGFSEHQRLPVHICQGSHCQADSCLPLQPSHTLFEMISVLPAVNLL